MATLADGTTVNQQHSEGWNIDRITAPKQWSEDWNMKFLLASEFTISAKSAQAPPIIPGEPVDIEGTALRSDGVAAPATIFLTDPNGNTTSWSADVATDGSFSERYTPEKRGTYTVYAENDLPEKRTSANWNFDRFTGSLVHDEGWNS